MIETDLHLHTHYSDGTWSPAALVEHAIKLGLKHIAITDHDTTCGIEEARQASRGKIEIISGIEFNTVYECADGTVEDVHVLGYFIDPECAELQEVMAAQKSAREQHILDCIDAVAKAGISITWESVKKHAGLGSIGRPHITIAIVEAGGARDLTEAYEKYMIRTSPFYIARKSVSPVDAIRAIKKAGGISSLAHPGSTKNIDQIIRELKAHGLDGLEAYHRIHTEEMIQHYVDLAALEDLFVTGGSDCHGPFEDFEPITGTIWVPEDLLDRLRPAI